MWRDGKLLVVRIGESFPDRCIKSNLPADGKQVEQVVECGSEWGLLAHFLSPLLGGTVAALAKREVQFFVGLSDRWKRKRRRAYYVAAGIIALSIGAMLYGIRLMQRGIGADSLQIWMLVLGVFGILGGLVWGLNASTLVTAKRITDEHYWLKGVHRDFLAELPPWPKKKKHGWLHKDIWPRKTQPELRPVNAHIGNTLTEMTMSDSLNRSQATRPVAVAPVVSSTAAVTASVNAPDPLLSGPELPTFKFALEKSVGKKIGNSIGREATVEQLPISKGIAGVSMWLEPGVMRELHWHATAAEWAFVISGRVRTTVIHPTGEAETNDFEPGDVWYFPRGYAHMLQCLGNEPTHFILIFDNGYFSEFGTFSISDWVGHAPPALLAKNFGLPAETFKDFPRDEVYFAKGPLPSEQQPPNLHGLQTPPETHKFRLLAEPPHSEHAGGREWRVDASRFPISTTMTGVVLDLEPGALRELHWHPTSDEWQYVISGQISVTLFGSHGRFRTETLDAGDVAYIPQGFGHSIENIGPERCRVLIGFNTGHYKAIGLSQWIAGNPAEVLATNFGQPKALFEKFPKQDVFIAPG